MKHHSKFGFGAVIFLTSVVAVAQMNSTPAPELKKLDYFGGTWTLEATIPAGPWGSGGKFSTTGDSEWMKGGFFLVNHADFSMPAELGGAGTGVAIFGYDPDKKVYTEDRFDSLGRHAVITGNVEGDTWTWTGESNYGGMTIKSRLTLKMISPTSYSSKYEVSADGGTNWMTFWEGKATKK